MSKSSHKDAMVIQTVIVPKSEAHSLSQAESIAKHFGKVGTHRETGDSYRFRQLPPGSFAPGSFRTKTLGSGHTKVTTVMGKKK